jgi:glycosyltransferase involved in cell wall biosynthesis
MDKISAVSIVQNEEANIRDCLESVKWCDEIVIVDSHSTDKTVEIARGYTDKIFTRHYDRATLQYHFAMGKASHEWTLIVDADERITPELAEEIKLRAMERNEYRGFEIPWDCYIGTYKLRFGNYGNSPQRRLFRTGEAFYTAREPHNLPVFLKPGEWGRMKGHITHYAWRDIGHYVEKLNRYSIVEAQQLLRNNGYIHPIEPDDGFATRLKKHLWRRMPCKPLIWFVREYLLQQGFRDGFYGFAMAYLNAAYIVMAYSKAKELKRRAELEGLGDSLWRVDEDEGPFPGAQLPTAESD